MITDTYHSPNRYNVLEVYDVPEHSPLNVSPLPILHHDNKNITVSPSSLTIFFPHPPFYVRSANTSHCLLMTIELQTLDDGQKHGSKGLLDCGATGLFVDSEYVKTHQLTTRKLPRPIPVFNIDGTHNEGGYITEEVELLMRYKDHKEKAVFAVCSLGKTEFIIGFPWLKEHNPEVDWQSGEINMSRCPPACGILFSAKSAAPTQRITKKKEPRPKPVKVRKPLPPMVEEVQEEEEDEKKDSEDLEDGDRIFAAFISPPETHQIRAGSTISQRLAEKSMEGRKKMSLNDMVPPQYRDYSKVFTKESFDELPQRKPWDHAIELKSDADLPKAVKAYPLSPAEQKELDAFLEENLATGRIRPSKSPVAAPVFFVKKKDGSLRLVQDYRKLNDVTIKNKYPLPLISELVNKLRKAKYFTKLDVRWGFNNVRLKEGDEWKAAFLTNRGLYEPLVMFFGLTNSPSTFQTMMNDILRELITDGVVLVYLDDILIFTETLDEHRKAVRRVLEVLNKHKLYLKPEKCEFEKEKIEYLGLVVSHGKIEMDPVKVQGVSHWPTPKNVHDVFVFLGFTNFYRRFIEDFADIARPLHNLQQKNAKWSWGPREQEAFDELKRKITSSPVLVFPDDHKPYRVEADSSDYATGAVLSQLSSDDKWHPVAFMSKSLNEVERNYEIHDKEMLAIIRALEEWRHFLEGAEHRFEIWTDHKNLQYFMTAKKLNRRQARWSLFLASFDFSLHHRPGKRSLKPDALSRRPDHKTGKDDNSDVVLLKPEFFQINALRRGHVLISGEEGSTLREIRQSTDYDEAVVKAVKELRESSASGIRSLEWSEEDGLVLFRGKVYVPRNKDLRRRIVKAHHDSAVVGHPGRWKTLELVARNYWWPGMTKFVAAYVAGCDMCNRTKIFPAKPVGTLMPNRVPSRRWQVVTCDLIVGLPESQGYDSIFLVIDRLSKRAHVMPTTSEVTSAGIARLFRDNVWRHHGLPEEIISDRGSQFVSNFMRELNTLLGIRTSPSTAYHPQTDGQTERLNQEIEQFLRIFVNHRQDNWVEWLPLAEFAYNNRIHSSTRQTPFMLDAGQNPRLGIEPSREARAPSVDDFLNNIKKAEEEAKAALEKAADDMARFYDVHRQDIPQYNVGEKVWLDAKDIQTDRPAKKLDDKWFGPFKIEQVVSKNAYKLALPANFRKVHPVFNITRLRRFIPDTVEGRTAEVPPPPVIVDNREEYHVERLDDSRLRRGKLQYLVKWKGYPESEKTWEPEENVKNSPLLVEEFHKKHPFAPRRISAITFSRLPFQRYENLTDPPKRVLFNWEDGIAHRGAEP